MTLEKLNRTMEFIVASQARLVAAQEEKDREDRLAFQRRLADLQRQQAELLVLQSERLDSFQKFHDDWLRRTNDFQARTEAFQVQALRSSQHDPRQAAAGGAHLIHRRFVSLWFNPSGRFPVFHCLNKFF